MKKVAIVGCCAYMENGYGFPGEWRCLEASPGKFELFRCENLRCEVKLRPLVGEVHSILL